jgi:putative redox protein
MKITIDRINNAVNLKAGNEAGNEILMDGSPEIGGQELGARPMQVLLMALGGCTSMDVLSILKKMRQEVRDYHVTVNGERGDGEVPAVFRKIHLHYILYGDLDIEKVRQAIDLSMEKYCSVSAMLHHDSEITYDFEVKE